MPLIVGEERGEGFINTNELEAGSDAAEVDVRGGADESNKKYGNVSSYSRGGICDLYRPPLPMNTLR